MTRLRERDGTYESRKRCDGNVQQPRWLRDGNVRCMYGRKTEGQKIRSSSRAVDRQDEDMKDAREEEEGRYERP